MEVIRAGLIINNGPENIAKSEQDFQNVIKGARAAQNLGWAKMDGPLAYNSFVIEEPSRMKLNEPTTEFRSMTRSKGLTGESDYEVDFRIKALS
jgi:hypothetical protein